MNNRVLLACLTALGLAVLSGYLTLQPVAVLSAVPPDTDGPPAGTAPPFDPGLLNPSFAEHPPEPEQARAQHGPLELMRLPDDLRQVLELPPEEGEPAPQLALAPEYAHTYRVVVQKYQNGAWQLFHAYMEGSSAFNLTPGGLIEIQPRLKPGASAVAWSSYTGGYMQIKVKYIYGGEPAVLTSSGDNYNPAWSPNGTHIAFESTRDGQSEIYVMNADGSGQTRLTWHLDYDGMPTWSPDGQWLTFISRRTGGYRIYIISADGTSLYGPLNAQPYSARPQWSPDGRKIYFDADGNNDGFQELYWMDLRTLEVSYPTTAPPRCDFLSGGLVANARTYSEICCVEYDGQWYWYRARFNTSLGWLPGEEREWAGNARSTDIIPPVSLLGPLPAVIGSPYLINFSATDADSGVAQIYIDFYDQNTGEWQSASVYPVTPGAYFMGQAGHSYQIWVQALDYAGNLEPWPATPQAVITIETLPPVTTLSVLPPYVRGEAVLRWRVFDPGGSHLGCMEGQWRIHPGDWMSWFECRRDELSAVISGSPGDTVSYRVRTTDWAGNVEPWSQAQVATTTFYDWRLDGQITDNTGAPLIGAAAQFVTGGLGVQPSDRDGNYVAYGVIAGEYPLSWDKDGYLTLPETRIPALHDQVQHVYLPPQDNLLPDFGFESGSLGTGGWQAFGSEAPQVTIFPTYTGRYGLHMGKVFSLTLPVEIAGDDYGLDYVQSVTDNQGRIQIVWKDSSTSTTRIFSRWREADGTWSATEQIATGYQPTMVIDSEGVCHLTYQAVDKVYYMQGGYGSGWSTPELVMTGFLAYEGMQQAAVDAAGNFHFSIMDWNSKILYRMRSASSSWSTTVQINADLVGVNSYYRILLGDDGIVHAVWVEHHFMNHRLLYKQRPVGGQWTVPLDITPIDGLRGIDFDAALDSSSHMWVILKTDLLDGTFSTFGLQQQANGDWTSANILNEIVENYWYIRLFSLPVLDEMLLILRSGANPVGDALILYQSTSLTGWVPYGRLENPDGSGNLFVRAASDGVVYLAYSSMSGPQLSRRLPGASWSPPMQVSPDGRWARSFTGLVDPQNILHVLWTREAQTSNNPGALLYAYERLTDQPYASGMRQELFIPEEPNNIVLALVSIFHPGSPDSTFIIQLDDDLQSHTLYQANEAQGGWEFIWLDLNAWRGQPVQLSLSVTAPQGVRYPYLALDDLSIGSAHPDLHLELSGSAVHVPAGSPVTLRLRLANRGGITAEEVLLTLDLPAGMGFTSASITPDVNGQQLSWDLGSLTRDNPVELLVEAYVRSETAWLTHLLLAADAQTSTSELQLENNQETLELVVNSRLFLPLGSRDVYPTWMVID